MERTVHIDELPAGTTLACSGASLISRVIERFTWSLFSHVAGLARVCTSDLVLQHVRPVRDFNWRRAGWTEAQGISTDLLGLCWFESTTEAGAPCLVVGKPVSGVQVHRVRERLEEYGPGRVWAMRLVQPLSVEESHTLTALLLDLVGTPYDAPGAGFAGMVSRKLCPSFGSNRERVFCCEYWLACLRLSMQLSGRKLSEFEPGAMNPEDVVHELVGCGICHEPERVIWEPTR